MPFDQMLKAYDKAMRSGDITLYYDNSDYFNFGYWAPGTIWQADASEALVQKLLSFIPEKTGKILDVACGAGASTLTLLKTYDAADIVAINLSESQLELGRKNAPGVDFRLMDACKLEFPDASFDNIICVEAAFHFDTRAQFLAEAFRVLKPGGRLVHSDIYMNPLKPSEMKSKGLPEANILHDLRGLQAQLVAAGFVSEVLLDATKDCWQGFYDSLGRWPKQARAAGKISTSKYFVSKAMMGLSQWYWRRLIRMYILSSAQKPA